MMMRQMVICTIDHTDRDLHNDQQMVICLMIKQIMICIMIKKYFDIQIYMWEHLELKLKLQSELKSELKLSNMYAYKNLLHYNHDQALTILHDTARKCNVILN